MTVLEDFTSAINTFLHPIKVKCFMEEENEELILLYTQPFFFDNECSYNVEIVISGTSYPLVFYPRDKVDGEETNVVSSEDWINHLDKIIKWKRDFTFIFDAIREDERDRMVKYISS